MGAFPSNLIKRAKVGAIFPHASGARAAGNPTTESSGRKCSTTYQRTSAEHDAANNLVACQSIRRKYPLASKQSSWVSRRSDAMCRRKHHACQASRTICWRCPASLTVVRSSRKPVSPWFHFHSAARVQPWDSNQELKACAGEPGESSQTRSRDRCKREKNPTSCEANETSRCMPPPNTAARNQGEAMRHDVVYFSACGWTPHPTTHGGKCTPGTSNKQHQNKKPWRTTSHNKFLPWTLAQIAFPTKINRAWRLRTSLWFSRRTKEDKEEGNSPSFPGISWPGGRRAPSQTTRHAQPTQIQSKVG